MTDSQFAMSNDTSPVTKGDDHSFFVLVRGGVYTAGMEIKAVQQRQNFWQNQFVRHLFYWVLPFVGFFALVRAFETTQTAVEVAVTIFIPAPFTAYLHYFVLKRYFETRKYLAYGLAVVVIVAMSSFLTDVVHNQIVSDASSHTSGVGMATLVILLSTGLYYFNRGLRQQYRLQEAEAKQLAAELALLRTQLHPHFLFNTLNGLYALALDRSEQMPKVVLKLSELLRYSLDCGESSRVPLTDEIRFLENYVDLEKLRLEGDPDLKLEIEGSAGSHQVAPMLLAPFVENSFKHGDLGLHEGTFLHARLVIEPNSWQFTVINTHSGESSPERSGLGLNNVRRRLELLHPGSHKLDIKDDGSRFEVVLEVQS